MQGTWVQSLVRKIPQATGLLSPCATHIPWSRALQQEESPLSTAREPAHSAKAPALKKDAFESVLMRWMKLDPILQSEVSQRKAPIPFTNAYIWKLEQWWRWSYMRDSKRDTDIKNSLLDSVGEGKGGMIWENSTEPCILSYVKQITSPGSMHEPGCSGLVHGDGEGSGRGFRMGNTCTPMADSCQCMATPISIV